MVLLIRGSVMRISKRMKVVLDLYTLDDAAECLGVTTDAYVDLWDGVGKVEDSKEYKEFKKNLREGSDYGPYTFRMPTVYEYRNTLKAETIMNVIEVLVQSDIYNAEYHYNHK